MEISEREALLHQQKIQESNEMLEFCNSFERMISIDQSCPIELSVVEFEIAVRLKHVRPEFLKQSVMRSLSRQTLSMKDIIEKCDRSEGDFVIDLFQSVYKSNVKHATNLLSENLLLMGN